MQWLKERIDTVAHSFNLPQFRWYKYGTTWFGLRNCPIEHGQYLGRYSNISASPFSIENFPAINRDHSLWQITDIVQKQRNILYNQYRDSGKYWGTAWYLSASVMKRRRKRIKNTVSTACRRQEGAGKIQEAAGSSRQQVAASRQLDVACRR